MFTGIVEACSEVRRVVPRQDAARLQVARPALGDWDLAEGDSLAVSGVCLTVAGWADPSTGGPAGRGADPVFDLSRETLARSWFGALRNGSRVNLERSLRLSDRLGGHLVSGHVDGCGTIVAIAREGGAGSRFTFEVDRGLERYLVEKGSIAVDGISLTVVRPQGSRFDVAVIPLTLERTSLGTAEVGQRVNLEADPVGKWIERLLQERA